MHTKIAAMFVVCVVAAANALPVALNGTLLQAGNVELVRPAECFNSFGVVSPEIGVDLKPGEWDGRKAVTLKQCEDLATKAGVNFFAYTAEVYGGYCKVIKPSVASPDLLRTKATAISSTPAPKFLPHRSSAPPRRGPTTTVPTLATPSW